MIRIKLSIVFQLPPTYSTVFVIIPPKNAPGDNDPPCHVSAAIGSLENSDQRRVLPHEHARQGIFRCDQTVGPGRRGSLALVDSRHKPGRFHAGWIFAAHRPKEAAIVSGEPPRLLGEEEWGQGTARTSIQPKIYGRSRKTRTTR